ncbi:acetyl-CoA carboxylase biotin carboxylase subunit [Gemmatimonadota bacterium]
MFKRVLVANRGEVAARIIRAAKKLGVETVAVYSTADADSSHLEDADVRVNIGGAQSKDSYLNIRAILQTALQYDCQAVHPGWGFLAENALFARLCEQQKTTFIGPASDVISLMGDKAKAKETMKAAGLPLIPGSDGVVSGLEEARAIGDIIGYPILLKARSGGGGKGMRVCRDDGHVAEMYEEASIEAEKGFGDRGLYIEKFLESGRHIEFQVLADVYGHAVHLGERECSVQRNHQKLIEEAPSPAMSADLRNRMGQKVASAAAHAGYVNAGTVEFLMDEEENLYFMEMNTRLQVEHPVTEMITGIDIMEQQFRIAANQPLTLRQEDIVFTGHAIECRINAEDPFNNFKGSPGGIERFTPPDGYDGAVRIDTHITQGATIPPFYDSMICKLIAHGETREAAIDLSLDALRNFTIEGVKTTIPAHLTLLDSEEFRSGNYDTGMVPRVLSALQEEGGD